MKRSFIGMVLFLTFAVLVQAKIEFRQEITSQSVSTTFISDNTTSFDILALQVMVGSCLGVPISGVGSIAADLAPSAKVVTETVQEVTTITETVRPTDVRRISPSVPATGASSAVCPIRGPGGTSQAVLGPGPSRQRLSTYSPSPINTSYMLRPEEEPCAYFVHPDFWSPYPVRLRPGYRILQAKTDSGVQFVFDEKGNCLSGYVQAEDGTYTVRPGYVKPGKQYTSGRLLRKLSVPKY